MGARHVQHRVDPTELGANGFEQRGDVVVVRDVAMHRQDVRPDFGGGVLLGTADVDGHDRGTFTDEHVCRLLRDAGTCAGDHGDLALEDAHQLFPRCRAA